MSFGYQKRRPLTEEEKSSDVAKARARALETLAAQEVSSGQLYERLCRRFTEQAAAEVVASSPSGEYVTTNATRGPEPDLLAARKSRRAAARNLRQKGLSAQQVAAALEAVYAPDEEGENPELSAAVALVESRYRTKLAAGRRDLVVAALQRRGFAYAVVKEAIKRVEEE